MISCENFGWFGDFRLSPQIEQNTVHTYNRHVSRTDKQRRKEDIMVDGNKLNSVLECTYLGSTISSNGCIYDEIQRRMAKASAYLCRLRQRLWNNHHVSMRVKGKIYSAIVLSTVLYGAEAWTVYRRQVKKLHAFMMRHLRSIVRITWMDKVTNKEILERTGLPSMEDLLIRISGGLDTSWGCHQTGYQSRFSTLNCLLVTELRAPSFPVQGYHQEKLEDERHKDRRMDITLTAERMKQYSSDGSSLCRVATDSKIIMMTFLCSVVSQPCGCSVRLTLLYVRPVHSNTISTSLGGIQSYSS